MSSVRVLSSEYATFRRIRDYIVERILPGHSVLYDPMAGTAPLIPVVETQGYVGYFNDISPVHLHINKAKAYRVFESYRKLGHEWFIKELLHCMRRLKRTRLSLSEKWMDDAVLSRLLEAWGATENYDKNVSTLLKAVVLLCVRPLSSITKSSNPTWIKVGGISSDRNLREIVSEKLGRFDKYYSNSYNPSSVTRRGRCVLSARNAAKVTLPRKVDLIVTSPPYCNRLDGFVQYGPENYFLTAAGHRIRKQDMIGTTSVRDYRQFTRDLDRLTTSFEYAGRFLGQIRNSPKCDDPGYYLKYYTRYFAMLAEAFYGIMQNLLPKGKMYVVVQDNIHRGQLIEIDRFLSEIMRARGWRSRLVKKWERHHLGLRNISKDYAFVKKKHFEKLLLVSR